MPSVPVRRSPHLGRVMKMKLPALSFTLCLLLDVSRSSRTLPEHEQRQERLFRARSDNDWALAWHQETHSRCRENIGRHLYWACEKDIYKLSRRNPPENARKSKRTPVWPLIDREQALTMLRVRRSTGASITDECCSQSGCTWEEYAEYCPNHRRERRMYPPQ